MRFEFGLIAYAAVIFLVIVFSLCLLEHFIK
jgi:hypothetical protein